MHGKTKCRHGAKRNVGTKGKTKRPFFSRKQRWSSLIKLLLSGKKNKTASKLIVIEQLTRKNEIEGLYFPHYHSYIVKLLFYSLCPFRGMFLRKMKDFSSESLTYQTLPDSNKKKLRTSQFGYFLSTNCRA